MFFLRLTLPYAAGVRRHNTSGIPVVDGYNSPKEGPAQNYTGIKSQRKFVRIFETLLVLEWNKEEEYILKFWERDEQGSGGYDKKNTIVFGKNIDYDYILDLIQ